MLACQDVAVPLDEDRDILLLSSGGYVWLYVCYASLTTFFACDFVSGYDQGTHSVNEKFLMSVITHT